ncbi:MAG: energy transducer TonB [Acidobacteriota bacterium]
MMPSSTRSRFFAFAPLLVLVLCTPPVAVATDTGLATEVTLLVGRPSFGLGVEPETLVVPGTVIPVPSESMGDTPSFEGLEEAHRALRRSHHRIGQVAKDLVRSLRLQSVEIRYRKPLTLAVGEPRDLPPPASTSTIRVTIELLGFNAAMASYEVQFSDGALPLTRTPLTVHRGKQAVVGGLDGEDAPYLFLLIAPAEAASVENGVPAGPMAIRGDVQPPIAINKRPATYTQEAREGKIEGEVVVKTTIERDGSVSEVKVLEGLPSGLSEAAVEAIKQWRFEPALLDGEPVAVHHYLTVDFRLSTDAEAEQEP